MIGRRKSTDEFFLLFFLTILQQKEHSEVFLEIMYTTDPV